MGTVAECSNQWTTLKIQLCWIKTHYTSALSNYTQYSCIFTFFYFYFLSSAFAALSPVDWLLLSGLLAHTFILLNTYPFVSNKTCSYKLLQQLQNHIASHACPFTNSWVSHHKTNVLFTESLGIRRHVLSRILSSSIIPYTLQTHIGSYGLFFLPLSLTSFWRSHEKSGVNTEENWACLWHWCQGEIKAVLWNWPGGARSRRMLGFCLMMSGLLRDAVNFNWI